MAHPEEVSDLPDLEMPERILALLRQKRVPMTRTEIRETLKVQNQRLGDTLLLLARKGAIHQNQSKNWLIGPETPLIRANN